MPKRKLNPGPGEKIQETGKVGRSERLRNLKYGTTQEQLKKMTKLESCPFCDSEIPMKQTKRDGQIRFKCANCEYTRVFILKKNKPVDVYVV